MVAIETAGMAAIGAGLAILGGALGTGVAQAGIGASAVGVIAEKPDMASKLIIWLVIPETIIIFSFVVALLLLFK